MIFNGMGRTMDFGLIGMNKETLLKLELTRMES